MPASLTRNEYYWENDRLVHRTNRRSSRYDRWHLRGGARDLVATIEDRHKSKKVVLGAAATPSRIAHVILREERLSADPNLPDISVRVPQELLHKAAEIVKSAVGEATRQFSRLTNEERRTGAITFDLNRYGVIEYDGWELTVILQGFSPQIKEPVTGADLGIIVDLRHGDLQVSKGVWAQAKEAEQMPANPFNLQDMDDQMTAMLRRTHEAYGIVYTPNGVFVFQGRAGGAVSSLESIIAEIVACIRGDRRPEFLADTVHRDFLVEIAFRNLAAAATGQRLSIQ